MSEKASGELSVRQLIALVKNALSRKADKSEIPAAVTESTVAGWGFTKNTGTYVKPIDGIPASDLAAGVIPTVPTKVSDLTNDSGYQTAPFVIPINLDGQGNWSTTASAEEIVDNADNCIMYLTGATYIVPMSVDKYDEHSATISAVSVVMSSIEYGVFGGRSLTIEADKSNNRVNVSLEWNSADLLPAVTDSDNGKFLRVVNDAWAAETVQTWQGGNY